MRIDRIADMFRSRPIDAANPLTNFVVKVRDAQGVEFWQRRYEQAQKAYAQAEESAAYWRRMYNGLLTLHEALNQAEEETNYVFDDTRSNGVAHLVPNENDLGDHPPFMVDVREDS